MKLLLLMNGGVIMAGTIFAIAAIVMIGALGIAGQISSMRR